MNKNTNANASNAHSRFVLAMALTSTVTVLAVFLTTYILLQIKFKEPIEITITDWLKLLIPIVGAAVVTVFAFLGVDRLKNFDERQDKLERQLREDLASQVDNAVKMVQPNLVETYKKWEENLQVKLSNYDDAFNKLEKRFDKYDLAYGSTEKLMEVTDAIGNIEEAHDFLKDTVFDEDDKTFDKSQKTRVIIVLVKRILNGEIRGDSGDYHNFASTIAKRGYYELAAEVSSKGLEYFKDDIDLISDELHFASRTGQKEKTAEGLSRIEKINKDIWNWRAFTFYIDSLNELEANQENKEKALACVEAYKRVLPDEERAYMAEYETLKKYGQLEAAENALVTAETKLHMTAQCSLILSEIYHMRGEYDKAIKSATRAIIGQAESQPSSNTGAAFAHRGFSRDAKVNLAVLEGKAMGTLYNDIVYALEDYKMALRLGFRQVNILSRIVILESMLKTDDAIFDDELKQDELIDQGLIDVNNSGVEDNDDAEE